MIPDKTAVQTFYAQAMFDYLGAVDQMTDLYDTKKIPPTEDFVFAATRLKRATEKLETVIKIAKYKYQLDLGEMPICLYKGGQT